MRHVAKGEDTMLRTAILLVTLLFAVPAYAETCYENSTGSWCCEDDGLNDAVLVLEKNTGWLVAVQFCKNGRNFDTFDHVSAKGLSREKVWDLAWATVPKTRTDTETGVVEWLDTKTDTWVKVKELPPYMVKLPDVTTTNAIQLDSVLVSPAAKEAILLDMMEDGITSIQKNTVSEAK